MEAKTAITTMTALAERLGKHKSTLSRWMNRPDWPFSRSGPWNLDTLERIKAWARQTLRAREREPAWTAAELRECAAMIQATTGQTYEQWTQELIDELRKP